MINVVCVANYLCTRSDISSLGVNNVAPPSNEVYRELGIQADGMAKIADRLQETLENATTAASL
jgi:hypothetical protein